MEWVEPIFLGEAARMAPGQLNVSSHFMVKARCGVLSPSTSLRVRMITDHHKGVVERMVRAGVDVFQ